uniref:Pyruvate phosphate dikinase AMP/ATP-binding domain-containing protein n=1 Tax=Timema bartmani TaxID=61472 RepID=A0A7R9I4J2_9NEOP|nr:unnamed protein product [Timema bartmani]
MELSNSMVYKLKTAAPLKPLGALSCETPDDYEGIYLSVTRCHITSVLVPPGLCLTVAAFQTQLEECSQLQKEITTLEKIVQGKLAGDLKQQCEKTVSLFGLTPVCGSVEAALVTLLGTLDPSTSFAVRSSAVGEDSEDLSAAGQNATFLGVQRHEELYTRKIIYSYLGGGQTDKRASERLSDYVAKLAMQDGVTFYDHVDCYQNRTVSNRFDCLIGYHLASSTLETACQTPLT